MIAGTRKTGSGCSSVSQSVGRFIGGEFRPNISLVESLENPHTDVSEQHRTDRLTFFQALELYIILVRYMVRRLGCLSDIPFGLKNLSLSDRPLRSF